MDLFGALSNAFNGLNQTQDALSVVSQNVAGANQPGYVRREYVGKNSNGLNPSVQRVLDGYVQKQLWNETSSSGYTSTQADYTKQLDGICGDPTGTLNLSSSVDAFKNALATLQNNQSDSAEQMSTLSSAKNLAQKLSSMSGGIQNLRNNTEDAISQSTTQVNTLLKQLASLNAQINTLGIQNNLDLLDNRDAALSQISKLISISVNEQPNGSVNLTTRSGASLVIGSQASNLSFDSHAPLSASSQYSSVAAQRSVGTLTLSGNGSSIDLLSGGGTIGGQLGGLVDLRDTILPSAQSQLDDVAAGLSQALSNRSVSSTVINGGLSIDTTGIQSGNRLSLSYIDSSGTAQKVTIIRADNASKLPLADTITSDPTDKVLGVDFSGGLTAAASAIQADLNSIGAGVTVVNPSTTPPSNFLSFTAALPAVVNGLSASITNTNIQGQGSALPVFIDSTTGTPFTGSFDSVDQRIGISARLQLNPALISMPSALVDSTGASPSGDSVRVNTLITQLTTKPIEINLQSGDLAGTVSTVGNFVKQVLQSQANLTNRLASVDSSQSVVLSSVQGRFSQASAVNMDEELTNLTALQNVYAANAKVMTTVREMFTVLMQL